MTMNLLDIIAPVIMLGTSYLLLFTAFMDEVGARDSLRPEFPTQTLLFWLRVANVTTANEAGYELDTIVPLHSIHR